MADFCNQCANELGMEPGDFLVPDVEPDAKFAVLCEGCGWAVTDRYGNCQHIGCHATEDTCKLGR